MPLFPRIAGRCPYERDLDAVVVDDWCRMCRRPVVDLTDLSDDEKQRLFAGCGEDLPCVRYRLPAAIAAAALTVTASGVAAGDRHHPRRAAHSRPPVVQPVMIPTAGVPVMPVQWHGDEHTTSSVAPTGDAPQPRSGG